MLETFKWLVGLTTERRPPWWAPNALILFVPFAAFVLLGRPSGWVWWLTRLELVLLGVLAIRESYRRSLSSIKKSLVVALSVLWIAAVVGWSVWDLGAAGRSIEQSRRTGQVLQREGQFAQAARRFAEAADAAEGAGLVRLEGVLRRDLAAALRMTGDLLGAETQLERSLAIATSEGDRELRVSALSELGIVAAQTGRVDLAKNYLRQAAELSRTTKNPIDGILALVHLSKIEMNEGDLDGAQKLASDALELAERCNSRLGQTPALILLGEIAERRAGPEAAETLYTRALSAAQAASDPSSIGNAQQRLGDVALRRSDLALAESRYRSALGEFQEIGDKLGQANVKRSLGQVSLRRGDLNRSESYLEVAAGIYRGLGIREGEANTSLLAGIVDRLRRRVEPATKSLEKSLRIYRDLGLRDGEAQALHELGEVALLVGDPGKAETLCKDAAKFGFVPSEDGWSEARCCAAQALSLQGRTADAVAELQLVVADPLVGSALASACARVGLARLVGPCGSDRYHELDAIRDVFSAKEMRLALASVLETRGDILSDCGSSADAAISYEEAGELRNLSGDADGAKQSFERSAVEESKASRKPDAARARDNP